MSCGEALPRDFMAGVAADAGSLSDGELRMISDAGIAWFRTDRLGFDPGCFLRGERQPERFYAFKAMLAGLRSGGFQMMGITPGPAKLPEAAGQPGSAGFLEFYRRVCRFLGTEFSGLIDWWQVANELDTWLFRGALSLDGAVDFLKAGIAGLNEADRSLKAGINITLFPSLPGEVDGNTEAHEGLHIARGIYGDRGLDLDYAGLDSYPGTWRKGGPESLADSLDAFHELTGQPVIMQEFGYASRGDMMSDTEMQGAAYPCELQKWRHSWRGAHTPEIQAAFITESYKVFAARPFVRGAFYYRWNDTETCWQCGRADCPVETAWGLVSRSGTPKPSYHALKAALLGHAAVPVPPSRAVSDA